MGKKSIEDAWPIVRTRDALLRVHGPPSLNGKEPITMMANETLDVQGHHRPQPSHNFHRQRHQHSIGPFLAHIRSGIYTHGVGRAFMATDTFPKLRGWIRG